MFKELFGATQPKILQLTIRNLDDVGNTSQIMRAASKDSSVAAYVIRIDGKFPLTAECEELYLTIRDICGDTMYVDAPKPVVVSVGDVCLGGAYFIASAATAIVVNKMSLLGGIGKYEDGSYSVEVPIDTGDYLYESVIGYIKKARKHIRLDYFDGRIIDGDEAANYAKFADFVGTIAKARSIAAMAAGYEVDEVGVVTCTAWRVNESKAYLKAGVCRKLRR